MNKLLDACSSGKGRATLEPTIKFLLNYVVKHFAHEEDLQKKYNYPGKPSHTIFHEGYKRKLRELASAIPASGPGVSDLANINNHIGVLVTHIRTEDKKLGVFLKNRE